MATPVRYDIRLVQGDNYRFELAFFIEDGNGDIPEDLTIYDDIIWSFRSQKNINTPPFEVKSISNGQLVISGDDNNILSFEFNQELYVTQESNFVHACLFIDNGAYKTRISGQLFNNLNAVKDSDVSI